MTNFEQIIQSLSEYTGLHLEINVNNAVMLEYENLIVTLQWRPERDDIAIFAPVTDPDKRSGLDEKLLKNALTIAYGGEKTEGNFLGLFKENLILSNNIPLENLTAEILSMKIVQFTNAASRVYNLLLLDNVDDTNVTTNDHADIFQIGQMNLRC